MFYKILLVWFVILLLKSAKELLTKKDINITMKDLLEKFDENMIVGVFVLVGILYTVPLIIFYCMSYKLSMLIGWLSVIQVIWAIRNMFVMVTTVNRYKEGRLKQSKIKSFIVISFDSVYLYLIIMQLLN